LFRNQKSIITIALVYLVQYNNKDRKFTMSQSPDLSPRSSTSPAPPTDNDRKRKITDDDDVDEKDNTASKASSKRLKRQKFKEKKNAKAAANPSYADIDAVTGLNTAIGRMNASHLADYIVKQTKKFQPELSVVELEDRRVPGKILVCVSFVTREHKNEEHGRLLLESTLWHMLRLPIAREVMFCYANANDLHRGSGALCLIEKYIGRPLHEVLTILLEYAFLDTSAWRRPRTLDNMAIFLEKYSVRNKGSLQHTPTENKGEPHTLVISSAGLRAADVTRLVVLQ